MPSRRAIRTRSLNVRLDDDEFASLERYADQHKLTFSEAVRDLLAQGYTVSRRSNGVAITHDAAEIIGRKEPVHIAFAPDPDDPENGPLWIVTPEELP
jgi:hypothetical protein